MRLTATLLDTRTGQTHVYEDPWDYTAEGIWGGVHSWTEGNKACDGNRSEMLYEEGSPLELPCRCHEPTNLIVLSRLVDNEGTVYV